MRSVFCFTMTMFLVCCSVAYCLAQDDTKVRIFWPVPPDQQVMEFVGVFSSQDDLGEKTKFQKFLDVLVGETIETGEIFPVAVTTLDDERVLVAERGRQDLKVLNFSRKTSEPFFKPLLPLLADPVDVATDLSGRIFVVDRGKNKVLVFGKDLEPLFFLGGSGLFKDVAKIAIDDKRQIIYVSDATLSKIFVFDQHGEHLYDVGEEESGPGQLSSPHGLAVSSRGELYVADTGNSRIAIFGDRGEFLRSFPIGNGAVPSPLVRPWDVAFDHQGNLLIIDQGKAALITCRIDGQILLATGASRRSNHMLGFDQPSDIHMGATGRIYVADETNHRFSVWQILTNDYLSRNPVQEEDIKRLVAYIEDLRQKRLNAKHELTSVFSEVFETEPIDAPKPLLSRLDGSPLKMKDSNENRSQIKCPNCNEEFSRPKKGEQKSTKSKPDLATL